MTEQELEDLAEEIGGFYGDAILFLGYTGLRMGEARALRVGDVMLKGQYQHINVIRSHSEGKAEKTTKSGRNRSVPIGPQIIHVVERYVKNRKRMDYLLSYDGRSQLCRGRLYRAANWGELGGGRSFHDLRHATAVNRLRRGIPANTVQAWLGHSDLEATNIYTSYLGMDIDPGAYDKLGRVTEG